MTRPATNIGRAGDVAGLDADAGDVAAVQVGAQGLRTPTWR